MNEIARRVATHMRNSELSTGRNTDRKTTQVINNIIYKQQNTRRILRNVFVSHVSSHPSADSILCVFKMQSTVVSKFATPSTVAAGDVPAGVSNGKLDVSQAPGTGRPFRSLY